MKPFVEIETVDKFKEIINLYGVKYVYFASKEELFDIQNVDEFEMKVNAGLITKKDIYEYDWNSVDNNRITYFLPNNKCIICIIKEMSN